MRWGVGWTFGGGGCCRVGGEVGLRGVWAWGKRVVWGGGEVVVGVREILVSGWGW